MSRLIHLVVAVLVYASLASAHFKFLSPLPRGEAEEFMTTVPCGSFNNATTPALWSSNDPVLLRLFHGNAKITLSISKTTQTVSNSDFVQVSSQIITNSGNATIPFVLNNATVLSKLGVTNYTYLMNSQRVIQAKFEAGDGVLYSCADVKLVGTTSNTTNGTTTSTSGSTIKNREHSQSPTWFVTLATFCLVVVLLF